MNLKGRCFRRVSADNDSDMFVDDEHYFLFLLRGMHFKHELSKRL